MTNLPWDDVNQRSITIEHKGRTLSGTYVVWHGAIIVTSGLVSKSALIGGSSPEALARIILREIA